jgi:dihydrofolate reductase
VKRLIVSEFVTLDGVMEAPGGEPGHPHGGWVGDFMGPDAVRFKLDEVLAAHALLIGRVTYESFAAAWPGRSGEFADRMNAMRKHVVSKTLREPAWRNTHVIDGDLLLAVTRLKQEPSGGPILAVGSRTLVQALIKLALVDEYRLMIFPVVLGSGHRLFPDSPKKATLRLADMRAFASGVVLLTYTRA